MFVTIGSTGLPSIVTFQYLCGVTLMTRNAFPSLSTSIVAVFAVSRHACTMPGAGTNDGSWMNATRLL